MWATLTLTLTLSPNANQNTIMNWGGPSGLRTTCTSVFQSDRDGVYRGLGPGEYACYNPVSYAMCSAASPSAPPPASYAVKMAVTIDGDVTDFTTVSYTHLTLPTTAIV